MKNNLDLEKLKFPTGKCPKIDDVSENDLETWIAVIENFPIKIKALTSVLSVEELNWIYRPKGWSIKQVVHHCADSHMNSLIRFKLALTEDVPTIKPYEEALWAELADGNSNDISPSIQIIEGVHARWVLILKSLGSTALKRQFFHPENLKIANLEETVGVYAWHCNHHLAHIKQALLHKGQF
ncbi:putative metal-dependent hydrolase [Flavobacterium franklandianum]|uniref:Putative metal-dependent hydrolase n=1 Tax=Flavobacterium franklandianum TaxID=2594430 RepID=A0A553CT60_9FLAO|nr:putative metal-dependent hydrolase [Flavobacterium franklandianum]TRX23635.1 putative metal-dependent hydrolase [Flavobacterium franklandianum]TRX27068.1 putative metal-dependent hydrolase [Flavobacterium franklandianum]